MIVGADLDGTALIHPGPMRPEHWEDEVVLDRAVVDLQVVDGIRNLAGPTGKVVVITGRTEVVRAVTESQVRQLFGEVPVFMQRRWTDWDALIESKANHLIKQRCDAYVGDLVDDERAAIMAGVEFHHADSMRSIARRRA